jgi:hypothetical protein
MYLIIRNKLQQAMDLGLLLQQHSTTSVYLKTSQLFLNTVLHTTCKFSRELFSASLITNHQMFPYQDRPLKIIFAKDGYHYACVIKLFNKLENRTVQAATRISISVR